MTKIFLESVKLTPGLFIVCCPCPAKKVYGFSMMIGGESPRLIFDIVTTQFPMNYNPNWIYDAACRAKEIGLNREPERFMKTMIVTDHVDESNHTTCLPDSKSSWYPDMKKLNKESYEQLNSILRCVASSVAYMSFDHYMLAITVFCAFYNLKTVK